MRNFSRRRIPRSLIILVLIAVVFLPAIPATVVNSGPPPTLRDQILAKQSSLNSAKAIALATQSNSFQARTGGLGFAFNSIFNTWSYSYNPDGSVNLAWDDVDVVYTQHNVNGTATNVVVTEDSGLTKVMNVTIQRNVPSLSPSAIAQSTPAAGLPLAAAALQSLVGTVQQSVAQPSQPATANCSANGSPCTSGTFSTNAPVSIVQALPTTPDFSLSSSVSTFSFTAGTTGISTITLTSLNGFVGSIALVATITPNTGNVPGIPLNVSSITLLSGATGAAILQILTTPATVAQPYSITVTATSGTIVHSVSISLSLNSDVQIYADPPSPSSFFIPGSSTSTIHIQSIGLAGTVTLTGSTSPSPANAPAVSLNPSSISVQPSLWYTSTLTIPTTASTPSGTYTVTVQASGATVTRSTTVTVAAQPDFTIYPGVTLYLRNGNSGTSSVSLSSLGLTGSVSLSASSPNGISASFGTNPVSLSPASSASSQVTLSVPITLGTGSYGVTITGTGPSSSHSTTLTVNVCDSISAIDSTDAGYTFQLACSSGVQLVMGAKSSWNLQSISEPQGFWCFGQNCDLSVSTALLNAAGTSAVFAGTYAHLNCGFFGCPSPTYYAYYDFLPNNLVQCSMSVNAGDSMTGEVSNNFLNPSLPSSQYFATITDVTKNKVCSILQTSSMGSPYIGQYLLQHIPNTRLPKFDPVTFFSCQLGLPGAYSGCSDAYNAGFATKYSMTNNNSQNTDVSTISSNSWTVSWVTSAGT